jgi:hypothetical protein
MMPHANEEHLIDTWNLREDRLTEQRAALRHWQ